MAGGDLLYDRPQRDERIRALEDRAFDRIDLVLAGAVLVVRALDTYPHRLEGGDHRGPRFFSPIARRKVEIRPDVARMERRRAVLVQIEEIELDFHRRRNFWDHVARIFDDAAQRRTRAAFERGPVGV